MAKKFSDKFYHSKQWKDTRRMILHRDHYTCANCSKRAEEVHHKTELTEENIHDINITLNPNNLISLCHDCHTRRTKGIDGDIAGDYCFDEQGQVIRSTPRG